MKTFCEILIVVFLGVLNIALGDIDIQLNTPDRIHENDKVQLTCAMDYPRSIPVRKVGHCSLWWSRPGDGDGKRKKVIKGDDDVSIVVHHGKDLRPERSILTIPRMREEWEGRYSCHVWCQTLMETGTITLTITPDSDIEDILGDKASVVGAIVTIFAIFIICVASCCCVAVEFCKRQNRSQHSSGSDVSDCEDAQLYDSTSTLSSMTPSLADPPPRYSLVVVSSGGHDNSVNIVPSGVHSNHRNSRLLNAIAEQDNISGLFVIPSPPPNYRQALMDLAEKGIIFNPESLRPPPPAYDELEDVDLNSTGGSETPCPV